MLFDHELDVYNLLKHPFYESWSAGALSLETLKTYFSEYYEHVRQFPRYVSGVHAQCDDLASRQVLLGNLNDEENKDEPHPKLWARLAEKLGCTQEDLKRGPQIPETQQLVDGYFDLVRAGYASGLGALYAYERQTPAVSISKMEGLQKFYGISDPADLRFFTVHVQADEWHAQECADLIEALPASQKDKAREGGVQGARLLWQFLDGMMRTCMSVH